MTEATPRIDPEVLLANAGWLRALARSLVADDHRADDVVQQTFVAAIEHPPREGVPLKPWLARVARNFSFRALRGEGRRARYETNATALPADASPEESAARTEMFRDVVDAVLALEPTYRDVVVARFFDGHEVRQIATRFGVPVETVRTRLKRALAMLRERLDRKHGDRRAWVLVLAAPAGAGRTSTPASVTTPAAGGALVATALVAAALVTAGWLTLRDGTLAGGGAPGRTSRETAAARAGATPPRERIATNEADPTPRPSDESPPADTSAPRWVLRGRIDGIPAGRAEPVGVAVYPLHETTTSAPEPLRIDAAADGRIELDLTNALAATPRPTQLAVVVDDPQWLRNGARVEVPAALAAHASGRCVLECRIELKPAVPLAVRVIDDSGATVSGARVTAYPITDRLPAEYPLDWSDTDASGAARVRLAPGTRNLLLAVTPGRAPATRTVTAADDDTITLTLEPGESISGIVTDNGSPVAGAELRLRADTWHGRHLHLNAERSVNVDWLDGQAFATDLRARSGDDGRYRFTGLTEGEHSVEVLRRSPGQDLTGFHRNAETSEEDADFDLAAAHVVVEVSSDGRPVEGAQLMGVGSEFIPKTGADGRLDVLAAPGRRCQIQTQCAGFRQRIVQFVAGAAGTSQTVTIALEAIPRHGTLAVVVKDADGRPIERFGLAFSTGETKPWSAMERFGRAKDGRFVVTDVDAGRYRLVVRPGRNWNADFTWDGYVGTWLDETFDVEVPATGETQIDVTARPGGRLRIAARSGDGDFVAARCEIRDAAGAAVPVHFATRYGSGGARSMSEGALGDRAPTDVAEALPPGKYRVTLSVDGGAERVVDAELLAGKTCVLDVTLDADGDPAPTARPAAAPAEAR